MNARWWFSPLLLLLACGARSPLRVVVGDPPRDASTLDVSADAPEVRDGEGRDVDDERVMFDCRTDPLRACDDRNACTMDRCLPTGACRNEPIVCDDEDPCTANRCEPSRGCVFVAVECGGCADGVRDAFLDRARYPDIAACAGGFSLPGLNRETAPTCARIAGDDGPNATGVGCRASDLCAEGFHVCRSAAEVRDRARDGCTGAQDGPPESFWATRQTGPGCLQCATGTAPDCTNNDCRADCASTSSTTNDIFGCGSLGSAPQPSCGPLDRSGNNLCSALSPPWRCDEPVSQADVRESEYVVKPGPDRGGVLCCRD